MYLAITTYQVLRSAPLLPHPLIPGSAKCNGDGSAAETWALFEVEEWSFPGVDWQSILGAETKVTYFWLDMSR
jgi:hypothetical protein